jgi:hypothetical protein
VRRAGVGVGAPCAGATAIDLHSFLYAFDCCLCAKHPLLRTTCICLRFQRCPALFHRVLAQADATCNLQPLHPSPTIMLHHTCAVHDTPHCCRYAGRTFETEAQAAEGKGTLQIRGIRAIWRQSAPLVQRVLTGVLEAVLMQQDVGAAVALVEREVRRLLTGQTEAWELAMTGGLWRITGQQIDKAAAGGLGGRWVWVWSWCVDRQACLGLPVIDVPPHPVKPHICIHVSACGQCCSIQSNMLKHHHLHCLPALLPGDMEDGLSGGAPAAAASAAGGGDEEVRGPHAALAVKLAQRDPGKKFLLGERLSYVLVAGARTQEEAAEDPLTAAQQALPLNYDLYWTNKLQVGETGGRRGVCVVKLGVVLCHMWQHGDVCNGCLPGRRQILAMQVLMRSHTCLACTEAHGAPPPPKQAG